MRALVAYVCGLLFAVGLAVGGMTQPAKIVNFLDVTGNWDPSLAFVMGGALLVNVAAYLWSKTEEEPVVDREFHIPNRNDIDWRLVAGGGLFGVGWGLSGFCPGPAVVAAVSGKIAVLATVGGMVAGVLAFQLFDRAVSPSSEAATGAELEARADA